MAQLRKRGAKGTKSVRDAAIAANAAKSKEASKEQDFEIVYKNGKAYRVLKDLPDVGYLITYGLPGQEGKSSRDPTKPWYTDFYLPGILLLVFIASLAAFHHIPFKPRMRPRFSLADIKARKAAQDEQVRRHQQVEFGDGN
eukprot:CAMPEP_0197726446 /NCGR_PEP_ID=MMETSP1434-20131217/15843_1 /TAXON_ID=265543 /ORGANISM="Minutocellus polymorphus, Strain CCMP3303" /LENGTH=140 /DNA_ID=CAMNT_0043312387 /DNA_START=94 /DNA_END=516 /DNA_ORIENTATION=+